MGCCTVFTPNPNTKDFELRLPVVPHYCPCFSMLSVAKCVHKAYLFTVITSGCCTPFGVNPVAHAGHEGCGRAFIFLAVPTKTFSVPRSCLGLQELSSSRGSFVSVALVGHVTVPCRVFSPTINLESTTEQTPG